MNQQLRLSGAVLLLAAALLQQPTGFAADAKKKGPKKVDETTALFSGEVIPKIKIEIPPEGVKKLSQYQWNFGTQTERENVDVTVREGTKIYTNVALHLKGAAGSFRPITDNPAMTLNFDKNVKGQKFHGLTKLSLNNSVQDPTLASEQFSRELFLKAGVPVPRAGNAVVELNGRDLGVYVLVEGANKQFLKRHFKDASGNFYDGGFVKDVDSELALNSGDHPKDQSGRIALKEAAQEKDLDKRLAQLEKTLDVERFLTYMALDVMLWDWDGYAQNKNNWRVYHDPSTGKMVFIPHGLDQLFWKPEGSVLPPMQGRVAKAVLQVPQLRTRYFERIKALRKSVFQPEAMTNRLREIAAKTAPLLKEKDAARAAEQESAVAALCEAIARRASSIDEQLANPIHPLEFDASGAALLAAWEAKPLFGHPTASRQKSASGSNGAANSNGEILQLGTKQGSSIGTWRSKVWLEAGQYRIEGRIKTENISPDIGDPRGGAGFRVAKNRSEPYLLGTSDWKNVSHEFSVEEPITEVQIMCEFRGTSGEASFESIRLNKIATKSP